MPYEQLVDLSNEQLLHLHGAPRLRRLNRGLQRKQHWRLKRLHKAQDGPPPLEKPEVVKRHLQGMTILPEMAGSMAGLHNGKAFNQVEIKPEMTGHYLGEFSIATGWPGIRVTHSSHFIPFQQPIKAD